MVGELSDGAPLYLRYMRCALRSYGFSKLHAAAVGVHFDDADLRRLDSGPHIDFCSESLLPKRCIEMKVAVAAMVMLAGIAGICASALTSI